MKINQKFNQLSKSAYIFCIDNHKKYTDFNVLGLYRSILENEKLLLDDKIAIRDYANKFFQKTYDFLQLKDVRTYFDLTVLGQELTKADENQLITDIHHFQEKTLKDKKIKHRNFGDYSKHNCGNEDCKFNGIMIKQGSYLAESTMHFNNDKTTFYCGSTTSENRKKDRKTKNKLIKQELELE